MEYFLEWLNNQSGDRLIGYGLFCIVVLYYTLQSLIYIFNSIFKRK